MSFALSTVSHPDRGTVARMIAALAEVFGEPLTEVRLEGYLAALADVPTEALRPGLQHALKSARYFPRPAELRASVDAARAVAGRVVSDHDDRVLVHCSACADTGMAFVGERDVARGMANTVRRCGCWDTNPKLLAAREHAKRYSASEERR